MTSSFTNSEITDGAFKRKAPEVRKLNSGKAFLCRGIAAGVGIVAMMCSAMPLIADGRDDMKAARKELGISSFGAARESIQKAMADSALRNSPEAYILAGDIELADFRHAKEKAALNLNSPDIDYPGMAAKLLAGHDFYLRAMHLDSLPDAKGRVRAKRSRALANQLNALGEDYYFMGVQAFNGGKRYPTAYKLLEIYGDLSGERWADRRNRSIPDTMRVKAYHLAGRGAFVDNEFEAAAAAFAKERRSGSDNLRCYMLEVSSWSNILAADTSRRAEALAAIENASKEGLRKFGLREPMLFTTLLESISDQGRNSEALALTTQWVDSLPGEPLPYATRAFIRNRMDDEEGASADYRKAAGFAGADADILKRAATHLILTGTRRWDAIVGYKPKEREAVRDEYWLPAKDFALRAKELNQSDKNVDAILDRINFALTTYF